MIERELTEMTEAQAKHLGLAPRSHVDAYRLTGEDMIGRDVFGPWLHLVYVDLKDGGEPVPVMRLFDEANEVQKRLGSTE